MADIRCPMCGKVNPSDLDVCQFCGARLKPLLPSTPDNSKSIKAGDQPVLKGTSEFEKVKPSGQNPIHPGEAPTQKNTADLERALPSWLRSLRGAQDETEAGPAEPALPEEDNSLLSSSGPTAGDSGGSPDWLAGLDRVSKGNEEAVPDWLSGLRDDKSEPAEGGQRFDNEAASDLGNPDWMARLDGNPPVTPAEPQAAEPLASEPDPGSKAADDTPAWLKSLHAFDSLSSEPASPPAREEKFPDWFSGLPGISAEETTEAEPAAGENKPDWLDQFQQTPGSTEESSSEVDQPQAPSAGGDLPAWLNDLQEKTGTPEMNPPVEPPGEAVPSETLPDWLNQLKDTNAEPEMPIQTPPPAASASGEALPDWLSQFQEKGVEGEPVSTAGDEPAPDWLSKLEPQTGAPSASSNENMPDWFSNLEPGASLETAAGAALSGNEPAEKSGPSEQTPSWLSQFQAEMNAGEETATPASAQENGAAPLPEWLAGIEPAPAAASTPPAFIADEKAGSTAETADKAFSMETPDWLSKVTPEQGGEKSALTASPKEGQEPQPAENIQAAELPSWVQAMRPVESVVEQAKTAAIEENQVTERSGPLAGLVGVLPGGVGLGMSRKPPAYSVKLQVSTAQQRYISNLEQLVSKETHPSTVKGERQQSDRLLRWVTAAILIFVVCLPFFFSKTRLTPSTALLPSDANATTDLLAGISANAPVLVAFDYDPALAGELESVASPLIDQLQSKGARLTIVSTSPTGPALAERFLANALLVNSYHYKAGEQYINLGYISGGPTGISFFASQPSIAMPATTGGVSAWGTAPLNGVSKLSDFAAVMVLTDDADTGRNWVEQAGRYLGNAPMIMVISAQAEPMVRPYFDSGQLKGLVSGLPDAKSYEQNFKRPGLANHYWDSFSLGTLAAELIIAIGAIWGALLAWRSNLQKSGKKG